LAARRRRRRGAMRAAAPVATHHGARPAASRLGLACVYSAEPVLRPQADACRVDDAQAGGGLVNNPPDGFDGSLNCAGYGSSVTVTATFGMVAAGELLRRLAAAVAGGDASPA
ncbi:MAG: hypothetical protein ACKVQR_15830, partial [Aquabacterium sp.]